jgi:mevalonate kinase
MSSRLGRVVASAPGKIILTGEHFVVHDSLALCAAIDKRVRVEILLSPGKYDIISNKRRSNVFADDGRFRAAKTVLKEAMDRYGANQKGFRVEISSEIPQGSGLGSSAATSVATAAAISSYLGIDPSPAEILKLADLGEKSVHGSPSGIDTRASQYGGIFLYDKRNGIRSLSLDRHLKMLVVFSGKTRNTSELVRKVNHLRKRFPFSFERLAKIASVISLEASEALARGDLGRLGTLMNLGQLSLSWIGVSTSEIDRLLEKIQGKEVFGAKITGAGGGGSVIALPRQDRARSILSEISSRNNWSFLTSIPQEGLRWGS